MGGIATVIGALGSCFSPWLALIVIFREILGVGVGLASVVCTTYVAELAPKRFAGAIGSFFQVSLTFGILVSYLVNLAFANVPQGFRWMFLVGGIPGVLICLVYFIMPPAPSDAMTQMDNARDKYSSPSKQGLVAVYILMIKQQPMCVLLGIVLAATLQLTGINAVLYYAPAIFENAGFEGASASLIATLAVGVWNFLSTFVAIFLVDRVGRRPLLLTGLAIMVVSLVILGFIFQFLSGTVSGVASIIFLFIFIIGFEMGIGSLFWPLLTETFDDEFKDAGASLMNVVQWTFNIILTAVFPSLLNLLSQAIVFWMFCVVGIICFVYLFFKLKEPNKSQRLSIQYSNPDYQFSSGTTYEDERVFSDQDQEDALF